MTFTIGIISDTHGLLRSRNNASSDLRDWAVESLGISVTA